MVRQQQQAPQHHQRHRARRRRPGLHQQQRRERQQQPLPQQQEEEEIVVLVKPSGMAEGFEILAKIERIDGATLVGIKCGMVPLHVINAHLRIGAPHDHWVGIRNHFLEGQMMAVIFRGPPGFTRRVKTKKKDIRRRMHDRFGRVQYRNFIHSSELREAADEVNLWRRWIGQRQRNI